MSDDPEQEGTHPRRHPTTAYRAVADEGYLVVVPEQGTVEVLNPTGGRIYSLLDGKHTVDDIIAVLVEEFEVGEAEARSDVRAFLGQLRARGLLAGANGQDRGEPEGNHE